MIQTNFNFPLRSQILSFVSFICGSHSVSCCSVLAMAVVLAQSLLPFVLIEVPWPNSGQVGLGGGISWKTVSKDLRAKSKDLPCWRKRKRVLLFASVCKCLSKHQALILGDAPGVGLGGHSSLSSHSYGVISTA